MTDFLKETFERLKTRIEDEKSGFKYVENENDAISDKGSFIWIGTEDNLIGDLDCHYEFIYCKVFNNERILTGVHIENPKEHFLFGKLKNLLTNNLGKTEKYNNYPNNRYYLEEGIPINDENLVEKAYQQLVKLDKKVGEEIRRIRKMNDNKTLREVFNLLTNSHNIILHGAPGTGKTYLARQIAESMEAETCFVQFHPSYDYTDFVEGLRPIKTEDSDESSEIGFERKDGVFKKFCKKALLNSFINTVDNFEDSWENLLEKLSNEERIEIPLIKDKTKTIKVELNRTGKGLQSCRKSPYFNKNQLYNVYRGLPGVRMKGNDNYRKAIVQYMKDNFGLEEYKPGEKSQENKNFVFIIDEINRGEMSKIFGELFFSIDPGYRGEKGNVLTQYANMQTEPNDFDIALGHDNDGDYGHFFVPENVYIIGTMNDIDRNVESMDFAIRRRFAFREITAAETKGMLDNSESWNGNKPSDEIIKAMKNRMTNLNKAIWNEKENKGIDGLSSAYHIGASYFLKYNDSAEQKDNETENPFDNLWKYHLKPLLQEYLRGMEDADEKLSELETAYKDEEDHKDK